MRDLQTPCVLDYCFPWFLPSLVLHQIRARPNYSHFSTKRISLCDSSLNPTHFSLSLSLITHFEDGKTWKRRWWWRREESSERDLRWATQGGAHLFLPWLTLRSSMPSCWLIVLTHFIVLFPSPCLEYDPLLPHLYSVPADTSVSLSRSQRSSDRLHSWVSGQ